MPTVNAYTVEGYRVHNTPQSQKSRVWNPARMLMWERRLALATCQTEQGGASWAASLRGTEDLSQMAACVACLWALRPSLAAAASREPTNTILQLHNAPLSLSLSVFCPSLSALIQYSSRLFFPRTDLFYRWASKNSNIKRQWTLIRFLPQRRKKYPSPCLGPCSVWKSIDFTDVLLESSANEINKGINHVKTCITGTLMVKGVLKVGQKEA